MSSQAFGERLRQTVLSTSPLCVGLDPSPALLSQWGLEDTPGAIARMGATLLDALDGVVGVLKPQVAFFERHGSTGIAVLEEFIGNARSRGFLVIADAKRGDIDSTMAAYGDAWLRPESPLCADALTVTAYLGFGAMEQVVAQALENEKGLFLVVASSNPEGRTLQQATIDTGESLESMLLGDLAKRNARERQERGIAVGSLGAVVGATRSVRELALTTLQGPYLVPGVGAQGATPSDVGKLFQGCYPGSVVVNASRSILAAGPKGSALHKAAQELGDELRSALG